MGEDLTCIGMSHRDPSFVMIGTAQGKILRTTDGGATWQTVVVTPRRDLYFGRERQPDPSWEYAPGLPGKSPYLQSWLRRSGLATSGINLAQLLLQKGDKAVVINWIEVSWHDERVVYVGTTNGLYRSWDRGRSFTRIFQGIATAAERVVNTVATDPADRQRILVGTASGMFSSKNGGTTFVKTMDYYMRDSFIREIHFDANQKGLIHVAMAGSAMASGDGGAHWVTTHWNDWGPRADVQGLSIGPGLLRLIGTRDGVFASFQGGENGTWRRRGWRFVGSPINKVLATNDPRVWYALTDQALWVTEDSGNNWRKAYQSGAKEIARWIAAFGGRRRHLWFITNREVYRYGLPPAAARYDLSQRASPGLLRVPELAGLVRRIQRHNHVYFPDNQRTRDRATWASLLPSLTFGAHYAPARDLVSVQTAQYIMFPFTYFNRSIDSLPSPLEGMKWEVMAKWDLARLIFDKGSLPHWGRIERNLSNIRTELMERVQRLYVEYRRIARTLVYAPPANQLAREYQHIRLQEIAAYFDAVSGGYWSKQTSSQPTSSPQTGSSDSGGDE